MNLSRRAFYPVIAILLISCSNQGDRAKAEVDLLPSWAKTETKQSILDFVQAVTDSSSDDYVEIEDRIAVFDNDGNLWSEQPIYFQLFFTVDRVKQMASSHPEWEEKEPFKSVLAEGLSALSKMHEHELLQLVAATHSGMSKVQFEAIVTEWLDTASHPISQKKYTEMVYQPMLELLEYLRANDFKTYIVSGGGIDFMRPWTQEVYGIPKDQVIGSSLASSLSSEEGEMEVIKLPKLEFIDDKEGKPIAIEKFIGKRPIFCSGNSDGDLAMMLYSASSDLANFQLYLHHTDSVREWAYDRNSSIGRLDAGLDSATARNWTVIDMSKDWTVVFPYELKP